MSADWMLVRIVVIVVGGVRIERYANEKQVIIREKTLDMRWGRGYIGIESVRENRHSEGLSDRPQESRCRILRLRIGLINTFSSWPAAVGHGSLSGSRGGTLCGLNGRVCGSSCRLCPAWPEKSCPDGGFSSSFRRADLGCMGS